MNIVFVTPELAPVAKVGGLADVAASLPRALKRLGYRVYVIVPRYAVPELEPEVGPAATGVDLEVEMDGALRTARLSRSRLNGVATYFVESDHYFDGRAIYGESGRDYDDNPFRFAFFSRATLAATEALGLAPDVIHVQDWQTALLPVYQRLEDRPSPTPVVLTVHNLAYQGIFPRELLPRLGLPDALFHIDGLEFYGRLNFLKGGLVSAERLTTVSPSYAREIQRAELGAGLEGVLRARASRLTGIVNGIEPNDWHPGKDPALTSRFASTRLSGKAAGKLELQKELGLTLSPRIPLLAAIGRLDPQKGFELVLEAVPALVAEEKAQLVVLGSGRQEFLDAFRPLVARFPKAISVNRGFQEALGRRIYAGADLFLMPSRYEPCGLGQMIALRYGTLPVVRATGGLADTIRDLDVDPEGGNGFSFEAFDASALLATLRRALRHYENEKQWTRWVRRAMREDSSWRSSARRYLDVYGQAIRDLG